MTSQSRSADATAPQIISEAAGPPHSRRQPFWHVIVLSVFTASLYLPYWYYKTVRDLRSKAIELAEAGSAMPPPLASYKAKHPALAVSLLLSPSIAGIILIAFLAPAGHSWVKLLGPLVPLLTLSFYTILFFDIARIAGSSPGLEGAASWSIRLLAQAGRQPVFAALSMTFIMVAFWVLSKCGGPFFLLYTLACLPLALAQQWLNHFWAGNEAENASVKYAFNPFELVSIIVGSLFIALIVISFSIKK